MSDLFLSNSKCNSIFRLIGNHENALTFSFGYVLSKNPKILILFLKEIGVLHHIRGKSYLKEYSEYNVYLQKYNTDKSGIMDIVIEDKRKMSFRFVIEAKTDNSLPTMKQLSKYVGGQRNKDWSFYGNKAIISLTVKDFSSSSGVVNNIYGIPVIYSTWSLLLKILMRKEFYKNETDFFIDELKRFMMSDFKIKHFEKEVITITVTKKYHDDVCMGGRKEGYYFNSARTITFPTGLFFVPCYGKYKKQALWMRRIKEYMVLSSGQIMASNNKDLVMGFSLHLRFHPNDQNAPEVHYFILSDRIKIPKRNRNFKAGNYDYSKSITDFLA